MKMANKNAQLHQARTNKNDEFYTQMCDVEAELQHYREFFKGKTVFCNCDNPYESNFFKYFAMYFNSLGLKKLIATCYDGSPVQGELPLFNNENNNKEPYKIVISEVNNENSGDIASVVEHLIKNKKNVLALLEGNGDFRSKECVELLKEADVVVTNPPFSLFKEYLAQLVEYNKKFLIISNKNALSYKEAFNLIKENRLWCGVTPMGKDMLFRIPESYQQELRNNKNEGSAYKIVNGDAMGRSSSIWLTNIDHKKRHVPLPLFKRYSPDEYPKYDNYDAIDVKKTKLIPKDYDGVMGVPITFLDKYCPEQFEIIGLMSGSKGVGMINGNDGRSKFYIGGIGVYARILICKRKMTN